MARVLIEPGTHVAWESQSQGVWKRKEGHVIALVPAGVDPLAVYPDLKWMPRNRVKFELRPSKFDRYIVQVAEAKGRGDASKFVYYAPRREVLERAWLAMEEVRP